MKRFKYRVRATSDLLGYVYALSDHEAWEKAKLKWGIPVATVEMV